jgi:hypothetical protein
VLRFQWNALRVGDPVEVHDPDDPGMALVPGVVALVQTSPGSNDLGIRVTGGRGGRRVVRPARLAVHLSPADASEDCWRCARLAAV